MVQIGVALRTCNSFETLEIKGFLDHGYSQAEISAALSWVIDRITLETGNLALPYNNLPTARMFSEAENVKIALTAQEYLTQLRQLRIISQNELERIIEMVMQSSDAPMTELENIKPLAAAAIFANADANNPGSRLMLNMNDSIQ